MLSVFQWLMGFSLISLLFSVNAKIGPQGMEGQFRVVDIIIALVYLGAWCYLAFWAGKGKNREVAIAALIYSCYPIVGYGLSQLGGPTTRLGGGLLVLLWVFLVQGILQLISEQALVLLEPLFFIAGYYWGSKEKFKN